MKNEMYIQIIINLDNNIPNYFPPSFMFYNKNPILNFQNPQQITNHNTNASNMILN